jgi:hypothetical protein
MKSMKSFLITILFLAKVIFAQSTLFLNTSNYLSPDVIFFNPAGISFNNNIQFSLGTQLLWTGISEDNLRMDYLSYSHPLNYDMALGFKGQYFSSTIFNRGIFSLVYSSKIYEDKISMGLNTNLLFYSYDKDKFNLVDLNDPLLDKNLSKNAISFGLGFIYQPNPLLTIGAAIDHINEPDISIESSGVNKGRVINIGAAYDFESVKPQVDLRIEEGDLLIQGGLWKNFADNKLNLFLGYDFTGSEKKELIFETIFNAGSFGFSYNFLYPLTELNSISSGCHRFTCNFRIPTFYEKEKPPPDVEPPILIPPIRGQKWAVIVGISEYKDQRIKQLKYASADARSFFDWLVSDKGGNYSEDRITLLLDEDATRVNIETALRSWLKNPIEEDMITIYFAGHGAPESPYETKNYYLLTYDTNLDNIEATAFPMWHVEDALSRHIKAKKVVIVADVCHAGGISDGFYKSTRSIAVNANNINSTIQNLSSTRIGSDICILNASSRDQLSQEGEQWGGGHGVFTYYLLEGLKGQADQNFNKKVTLGEISNFVSERVRRATRNAQTPVVGGTYDPQLTIKDEVR